MTMLTSLQLCPTSPIDESPTQLATPQSCVPDAIAEAHAKESNNRALLVRWEDYLHPTRPVTFVQIGAHKGKGPHDMIYPYATRCSSWRGVLVEPSERSNASNPPQRPPPTDGPARSNPDSLSGRDVCSPVPQLRSSPRAHQGRARGR